MALPKLNNLPKYEVVIPSTKQTIKFRPFLVKEQKVLLMALESQDQKQILNAIVDTIKACSEEDISVKNLTSSDIEYLFMKIRSKSVGEKSTVRIACKSCEKENNVEINLDDIKVEDSNKTNKIELSPEYTLQMKYPTYTDILNTNVKAETAADQIYSSIILAMDKLHTSDELIELKNETWEEKETFIDSLTNEQFQKIVDFIMNAPNLKHEVTFNCEACGEENKQMLRGIQDFF